MDRTLKKVGEKEAIKLKEEIEQKMGCSIYSIFPEITENLNKFKSEE